ncbi:MAG TPA: rRNA maturation RNase YbeY [Bacteroidia bacterium]|nr:rRNA maturation RNase YbeY [Bacteroidia bacterium]
MAIVFSNNKDNFKLKKSALIKKWIEKVAAKEKRSVGDLSYVFMSDEELLKINQQFLKHNTYTDIITFDYSESKKISGEIFISVDRVEENAKKMGTTFEDEIHRVIIHGVLHLCGYKDKTKIDSDNMRKQEDKALRVFNALTNE